MNKISYTINKINFSPATDINAILDASARAYKFAVDSSEAYWAQSTTVENVSYGMKNYTLSIDVAANPGVWALILELLAVAGTVITLPATATVVVVGAMIIVGGVAVYLRYQATRYLVGQLALESSSGAGTVITANDLDKLDSNKKSHITWTCVNPMDTIYLPKSSNNFTHVYRITCVS